MKRIDLQGKRLAVYGYGREGRSVVRAIRQRLPEQALTVLNDTPLDAQDAHELRAAGIDVRQGAEAESALAEFEVIIKSPGISRYLPRWQGLPGIITSATRLWLAEHATARVVAVTGSKGKSTTASLLAHLLNHAGIAATLGGNIGKPLFDLPETPPPQVWVVELSSYQTSDLDQPVALAVLVNLFPEHLDWHGSVQRYYQDKLNLARQAEVVLANAADAALVGFLAEIPGMMDKTRWFNHAQGLRADNSALWRDDEKLLSQDEWPLLGAHNLSNLAAALAAARYLGAEWAPCLQAARTFRGLPHRLYILGERDGVRYVDDSISTTPQSTQAALTAFAAVPVTLLVGGYDRGLDWSDVVAYLAEHPIHLMITMGASGPRIAAAMQLALGASRLVQAASLAQAVAIAQACTPAGGVVLLSPGAPSYGMFHNFQERGQAFALAAGLPHPEHGRYPEHGRNPEHGRSAAS